MKANISVGVHPSRHFQKVDVLIDYEVEVADITELELELDKAHKLVATKADEYIKSLIAKK